MNSMLQQWLHNIAHLLRQRRLGEAEAEVVGCVQVSSWLSGAASPPWNGNDASLREKTGSIPSLPCPFLCTQSWVRNQHLRAGEQLSFTVPQPDSGAVDSAGWKSLPRAVNSPDPHCKLPGRKQRYWVRRWIMKGAKYEGHQTEPKRIWKSEKAYPILHCLRDQLISSICGIKRKKKLIPVKWPLCSGYNGIGGLCLAIWSREVSVLRDGRRKMSSWPDGKNYLYSS